MTAVGLTKILPVIQLDQEVSLAWLPSRCWPVTHWEQEVSYCDWPASMGPTASHGGRLSKRENRWLQQKMVT